MVDYHAQLRAALLSVLPTHYEMTLTSGTATPCISYMETNNAVETNGFDNSYSRLGFQVKVWATSIADIQRYALEVDNVLRPLGFKRTSSRELYDYNSSMIQKIMTYEALAYEGN
jgi:hypothetical protein